jgi:ribokinase
MADMFDTAVVGSLHLDIMAKAPRLPALDETVMGQAWKFKCGGKGGNQAVAASNAGARTAFVGCVGDDDFGKRLLVNLDSASVDRSRVTTDSTTGSGMSVAIEDADGNYSAVVVSGANQKISPVQFVGLSARVLLLQNEIAAAINLAAASTFKRLGAYVIYNTAPFLPLSEELLRHVDLVVANRVEATDATGVAIASLADASRAAKALALHGCSAIVTAGEIGCALWTRDGGSHLVAATKVDVISTHGAGDVFCGTLAARIADGAELAAAVTDASLAAAQYVSTAAPR